MAEARGGRFPGYYLTNKTVHYPRAVHKIGLQLGRQEERFHKQMGKKTLIRTLIKQNSFLKYIPNIVLGEAGRAGWYIEVKESKREFFFQGSF